MEKQTKKEKLKQQLERLNRLIEENKFSGIIIAIFSFIVVSLFSFTDFYKSIELTLFDFRFRMKPSVEEWDRLTFINMDDPSLTNIGKFPWSRDIYSYGLDVLDEIGINQVTFDIIFPDKSPRYINDKAYKEIKHKMGKGARISNSEINDLIINNDFIFSSSILKNGRVMIPFTFSPNELTQEQVKQYSSPSHKKAKERFLDLCSIPVDKSQHGQFLALRDKRFVSIAYPIPEFMNTAKRFGYVNTYNDIDGTLRNVRLVHYFEGRVFFHMALSMVIDLCKVKNEDISVEPGNRILLKNAFNPVTHEVKDLEIPMDEKGMLIVNWAGPGPIAKSFKNISYYSLMEYPVFKEAVHEVFDQMGIAGENIEISNYNNEIEQLVAEYQRTDDASVKKEKWDKATDLKKKITKIRYDFIGLVKEEIKKVNKEISGNNSSQLQEELAYLTTQAKAMKLVTDVENLRNNVAITGLTATSSHDLDTIPIATLYARVGIFHNTINTILQESYINKVPWWLMYLIMLLVAISIGYIVQPMNARLSLLVITSSIVILNIIVVLCFILMNLWVQQLGISLALLLPSILIASIKFINEETQKRFIKSAFSQYLAPGVIEEIIDNPDMLKLGGEERIITIFFSDVASFSSISEKLTPPELVKLLNEYLSEMTDIILQYNGTIDKYEGDAVMAFYGAPKYFEEHALNACLAGIDMKKRLAELREHWKKQGKDELRARMGMNTGKAVVGNMGSKTRMDYTVMGDSVNLASRLEGANKYYDTNAMISESTYELVSDHVQARELDIIRVIGKNEPVRIYELLGRKGELSDYMYEMLDKYNAGLNEFKNKDWKKARTYFRQALKIVDDDGPSATYLTRCNEFIKKPPSKKWDGVYSLKSK